MFKETTKRYQSEEIFENNQHYDGIPVEVINQFGPISMEWLCSHKAQIKASSFSRYTNLLESYLIPVFGERQILSITRTEITTFISRLLTCGGVNNQGLAPKTVNCILSVMKSVFRYASVEKSISPLSNIDDISVRQPQKPLRVLSRNEQLILSEYLRNNLTPCHLGILLCLYTGMRIGEVCALKWEDIYIEEQLLFVHRSMQRIQTNNHLGKKTVVIVQEPKSDCSIRKIPIPDEVLNLLLPFQKQREAFFLTGATQSYIEPRCMENYFKSATNACGISDISFHALRHTFATRCVELGFDIKSLSEILGHASVTITLNRYVHPSMELKKQNMNRLSVLLTEK